MDNRKKILLESIDLFNRDGVVSITTNHICKHLHISPGNLYFHFRNKEAILHELFQIMCEETYSSWKINLEDGNRPPLQFIEESLEVFWKYRFFHREMYHVRRKSPALNELWHKHLNKTRRLMKVAYVSWTKQAWMVKIEDPNSLQILSDLVLVTASSFFQFYESGDRPASRRPVQLANQYMQRFLQPYFSEKYLKEIIRTEKF
jgi:AcrR family transcriptional regulator